MYLDLHAPWDGRFVARIAQAGPIEAWLAARAAERAFPHTRQLAPRRRAGILRALAAAVRDQGEALVLLLRDEGGKPVSLGRVEVERSLATLEACAAEALRSDVGLDTPRAVGRRMVVSRTAPRGPTLALTAFASPLLGVCLKLGAAVAAGCPIVVRPSPRTPSPALALGLALVNAGWPEGAISVLPCDEGVADHLVADPRFATVTFACPQRASWRTPERCERRGLVLDRHTHVTVLIEADADLDATVEQLARDTYAHAGQLCTSMQRILVHERVHAEVCARFALAAAAVPRGDPGREDVVCGPIIDADEAASIEAFLMRAETLGATRLVGGDRIRNLVTPTALRVDTQVAAPLLDLLSDEASGPVAVIEPYASLEAALHSLNRQQRLSDTGLYTRSMAKVWQVFERLDGGALVHNGHPHGVAAVPKGAAHEGSTDVPVRQTAGEARRAMDTLCEARSLFLNG